MCGVISPIIFSLSLTRRVNLRHTRGGTVNLCSDTHDLLPIAGARSCIGLGSTTAVGAFSAASLSLFDLVRGNRGVTLFLPGQTAHIGIRTNVDIRQFLNHRTASPIFVTGLSRQTNYMWIIETHISRLPNVQRSNLTLWVSILKLSISVHKYVFESSRILMRRRRSHSSFG